MILRLSVFLVLMLGLSGCIIPLKFTRVQGAIGSVVDEASGRPIESAKIVIETSKGRIIDFSDSNGLFDIHKDSRWGAYIVPMEPSVMRWSIDISADGYFPYHFSSIQTDSMSRPVKIGQVLLKKQ